MFRFIFVALVAYLGYRFIKNIIPKDSSKQNVKGKQKSQPLDLRKSDVEDAKFKDIDEWGFFPDVFQDFLKECLLWCLDKNWKF